VPWPRTHFCPPNVFLDLLLAWGLQNERGMEEGWRFSKAGCLRELERSTTLIFCLSPWMIISQGTNCSSQHNQMRLSRVN